MAHAAEAPRYRLIAPLYAGDEFIPEDEVIDVDDADFVPNEHMIPLNDAAKEQFQLFMNKVNGKTPDMGDLMEEAYRNRPRHEITPIVPTGHQPVKMRESAEKAPLTGYDGNTQSMTSKRKMPVKPIGQAEEHGVKKTKKVMGTVSQEIQRGI
jgi:hypothetical protein